MNDEGIGIAGWVLADLVLVLALIFLAVVPGRDAAPTEPPVILDIGCSAEGSTSLAVECLPQVEGQPPLDYSWRVSQVGEPEVALEGPEIAAVFTAPGSVTLFVSNRGGRSEPLVFSVGTPVRPENCSLETDFRFSQLVLLNVRDGQVSWDDIARSSVREDLIKSQEDEPLGTGTEWSPLNGISFLRERQLDGFRIALIETFSNSSTGNHTKLSAEMNEVFHRALGERIQPPDSSIFVSDYETALDNWFAAYRDESPAFGGPGTVRVNIYFVKPPDENCVG